MTMLHERWERLRAETNADADLAYRLTRLTPEGLRLWAQRCKARVAAGEPVDGLGWRALVDVRRARRGTPDADVPEVI